MRIKALSTRQSLAFSLITAGLLTLAASLLLTGTARSAQDTPATSPVLIVDIEGAIGPATSLHVTRGLETAAERNAEALVLRIDTPGGLDTAMREIIKAILASPVPVISYVTPSGARAASAGTYILYASHVAAMAPATNLGAATPIPVMDPSKAPKPGPAGKMDKQEEEKPAAPEDAAGRKVLNDAVAYIRGLAERRGRNADWAEKAVREGASLSAEQALEQNVIDLMAPDIITLLAEVDGRKVNVAGAERALATAGLGTEVLEPDWRIELLAVLTNPTVAYILMMIGIYGLILEGYNPGAIVPGVVGAICLLLALYAFQILPINYAGLGLIILGVILMVAETLAPSFGALGFGGIAAFVIGSVMLLDTDTPGYEVPIALIAALAIASSAVMLLTVVMLMRSRGHAVVTGTDGMLNEYAEAMDDFSGEGRVMAHGETWSARSTVPIQKGQRLKVVAIDGLTLTVEPAKDQ